MISITPTYLIHEKDELFGPQQTNFLQLHSVKQSNRKTNKETEEKNLKHFHWQRKIWRTNIHLGDFVE